MPIIYKVISKGQEQFSSASRSEALKEAKRLVGKGHTVIWEMWEGVERVGWKSILSLRDSLFTQGV